VARPADAVPLSLADGFPIRRLLVGRGCKRTDQEAEGQADIHKGANELRSARTPHEMRSGRGMSVTASTRRRSVPAVFVVPSPSDVSDHAWAILAPVLPPAKPGGRPRRVDRRMIHYGIFPVRRSGSQGRLLSRDDGPWSTVSAACRRWRLAGVWERIHHPLRAGAAGGGASAHPQRCQPRSARTRHQLVDTLGVGHGVRVPPADVQERAGACQLLPALWPALPRRELIRAESAEGGRYRPGSGRPWAGACRSPGRPADGGRGGGRTRSHPPATRLPTCSPNQDAGE
jgi:transposase